MKIAIVGCGGIAKVHARCINNNGEHKLVAVADKYLEKAKVFAEEFGGVPYASLEEMLDQEQIDVLHICTPHYLHAPMAEYALKKNVHVFMEKPAAITQEEFNHLKANRTDNYLGFCLQNRYNNSVQKAKALIQSGESGKVIGARGLVTWNRTERYYNNSEWRGKLATEGGGALMNQSVHTLDLLHYLVGTEPVSVDAVTTNHHLQGIVEVEDMVSAYIVYPDRKVTFYATTSYIADIAPLIEIECENMRIRIEQEELTLYHKDGRVERVETSVKDTLGKSYWGSGHGDCIGDFYDCVLNGRRFMQDVEGVEESMKLMFMIYESAKTGATVYWKDWN